MKNFKIIPLLVFVALLSFSVRLAEVVRGVSSLSGAAHAEEAAGDHEDHSEELEEVTLPTVETPDGDVLVVDPDHADPAHEEAEMEAQEWRGPVDEDPAYAAIKADMFEEMKQRRQVLDAREKELATREALLQAAEQELDRKYLELTRLREEMEVLLNQQETEEKAQIKSLVKVYEGMKPKDAARIFDTLDIDVLIAVVSEMSERKLSPVLAEMNAERARTITIMLAEQKALPILPSSN